ncbi:MAG: DUF721 domain-containing protein [Actinomycetes bacterium]
MNELGPDDAPRSSPGDASRSGLDVAREALNAAKAEARRRGLGTRRGATGVSGSSGQGGTPTGRRGWRSRGAEQRSGAHPDERDPQPLGSSVDRLLAERGWETDAAVGGVMGRWSAVVGNDLAAHCVPLAFDDGELVVRADSTAWATQVRMLAPNLVRRLNEEVGEGTVAAVRVLGPGTPSWKRGPLSVRGRGPRDTYG